MPFSPSTTRVRTSLTASTRGRPSSRARGSASGSELSAQRRAPLPLCAASLSRRDPREGFSQPLKPLGSSAEPLRIAIKCARWETTGFREPRMARRDEVAVSQPAPVPRHGTTVAPDNAPVRCGCLLVAVVARERDAPEAATIQAAKNFGPDQRCVANCMIFRRMPTSGPSREGSANAIVDMVIIGFPRQVMGRTFNHVRGSHGGHPWVVDIADLRHVLGHRPRGSTSFRAGCSKART